VTRLVADANMSRRFVEACQRLQPGFPIIHLNDWLDGSYRLSNDRALLQALREKNLILVGFDRRTMAVHAGQLTREESGHAGVILFRRLVSQMDYGKQSRLLVEFWKEAQNWEWTDRICYLPEARG
jgi:hypothetical protein